MTPVSERLWKSKGNVFCHSMDDGWWKEDVIVRWEINLSQRIKIKNKRAMKEIIDPIEDKIFHFVKASG